MPVTRRVMIATATLAAAVVRLPRKRKEKP